MSDKKILVVHFVNHVLVGKALVPMSYMEQGHNTTDSICTLSDDDSGFLRIDHKMKVISNKDYSEHIPWQQISKVIFED